MSKKHIDIEKIIKSKSPKLLKILPRFIVGYLRRLIHQDQMNTFLSEHGNKEGLEFLTQALLMLQVKYHVKGLDKLPADGRYVFASNHPLGGLDGMVLIHAISQKFASVKFPVNDLLMNITQLTPFFIPVNKHGAQSSEIARLIEEAYSSNGQILYFPAGLCSRKRRGIIEDLEWKKSFVVKALKHQRDIVPVFMGGRNSDFFYKLSNFRTALGVKANIEMLFLVDEMYSQRGQTIEVTIGNPVSYHELDFKNRNAQEWANWFKAKAYQLRDGNM